MSNIFNIDPQVGDGVTMHSWSDRNPGTVIKRTAKTVVVQADRAVIDNPQQFHAGLEDAKFRYIRNPEGYTATYTLRSNGQWKLRGHATKSGGYSLGMGQNFYRDPSF